MSESLSRVLTVSYRSYEDVYLKLQPTIAHVPILQRSDSFKKTNIKDIVSLLNF